MRDRLLLFRATCLAPLVLAFAAPLAAAGLPRQVTIRGNGAELAETPLTAEVPASVTPGAYVLVPSAAGPEIPALVYQLGGKNYLGLVLPQLKDKAQDTYSVRTAASSDSTPAGVEFQEDGSNLRVLTGGQLFTKYIVDPASKPYFFPVVGPTGVSYTRAYPMQNVPGEDRDHPHQRSLWFTHGKVNGIDFWSELKGHGTIRERSRQTAAGSKMNTGALRTEDEWLGPDGKKVCDDERIVRFYNTKHVRVMDFEIILRATAGPVTFGDTKEGMFGVRVASSMDVKHKTGGKITNAEGITDDAAWGKASPWVDYVGPVDGKAVGIAILNHPESFRFPTTWHVRTYGLFAANPFGWHDFGRKERGDYTLSNGQTIAFRYRLIFHQGDTGSAQIPAAFEAYSRAPQVDVQAD